MLASLILLAAFRLWMPYREFCEKMHLKPLIESAPQEYDRMVPLLRLQPESGGPAPVTLLLRGKSGSELRVEPAADGAIALPLRRELWDENPDVLTSVPAGTKTKVTMDLRPVLPAGLSFSSVELFKPVEQVNHFIHEAAGFFSFAAPKMKGLKLRFAEPRSVRVGGKSLPAGKDNVVELRVDDSIFAGAPTITLPVAPLSADFLD